MPIPSPTGQPAPRRPSPRPADVFLLAGAITLLAGSANAHVKWFAPYIVGASPQPIGLTLTDPWFWAAIGLVLVFFLATRALERTQAGETLLLGMDRLSRPIWPRADDFFRVAIGTFFVAIFAVGGVYLTPDLATPAEWVSWFQLLIAAGVFWRRTMPLSALGILILWVIALRDYDFFHLLDYLALGIGVAGYMALYASRNPDWHRHRFEVLRWGVAIALMWSSLEKFAYPEWFYPLVEEKPFLTFGLPRDVFIPMAGVAEFTMGFGLLWTPLVRRLSSIALLVIFLSAVWPFGRVDMLGHALIMATILVIAADPEREVHFIPRIRGALAGVPLGLATALVVFVTAYWGTHRTIYGPDGAPGPATADLATHSHNPEEPHGPMAAGGIGAPRANGPILSDDGAAAAADTVLTPTTATP
ncbi:DUF305 domain-containing protein [Rubellimicrobium roseum]|uniref:DUF305 domain-containing protein n=1 Tax=Rubellimicrobium roseum TaxID=687525 RepID=UPI001FEB7301|nr:DUF305 domain-containing protein [Rubellimicrobium roseum]